MSLPEDLRQEYLQAMGIESYFPRVHLPGAPESVACEWPDSWQQVFQTDDLPSDTLQDAPETTDSDQALVPPASRDQELLVPENRAARPAGSAADSKARFSERSKEEPAPAPVKTKPAQEEIRLQLLCCRVNNDLAVLNVMPHLGPQHLSAMHRNLLANLLRAVSISHDQLHFDDKPFRWPMVQGGHVDNSKAAAAIALKAFLEQKQADWQFKTLLVMGENAVQSIFSGDEESEDSVSASSLDATHWQNLYCRSLDECLHSPQLKKEVWSVLRQLRH